MKTITHLIDFASWSGSGVTSASADLVCFAVTAATASATLPMITGRDETGINRPPLRPPERPSP